MACSGMKITFYLNTLAVCLSVTTIMQRNAAIYCVPGCGQLETNINVTCAYRPSPYRAVNTLRLYYKKQSVNVV
jgi:hypothetical protein